MFDIIKRIIIGIVQGLTEFLPISSSAHIRICKEIFSLSDEGVAFDVLLHFGTLVAVCIFYRKDVWGLIKEAFLFLRDILSFGKTKVFDFNRPQRLMLVMITITTIPTAIVGFLLEDAVENIFSSLVFVGIALVLTSLMLVVTDKIQQHEPEKNESEICAKDAFLIGICQSCAVVPGLSRSGATVFGGRVCGFDLRFAVKYSFLCSLPAIIGAIVLKAGDISTAAMTPVDAIGYVAAFAVSAAVGYLSLGLLDMLAKKKNFKLFAYYCAIVGVICIAYSIIG